MSFQIANIEPKVGLPSGACYAVEVLTRKERIIPKTQCDEIKKRAIFITSTDWKAMKQVTQKNCLTSKCKQIVGAFDGLFLTIDEAFKKLP